MNIISNILTKLNDNEKVIRFVDRTCNKNRPSPKMLNEMMREIHKERKD